MVSRRYPDAAKIRWNSALPYRRGGFRRLECFIESHAESALDAVLTRFSLLDCLLHTSIQSLEQRRPAASADCLDIVWIAESCFHGPYARSTGFVSVHPHIHRS